MDFDRNLARLARMTALCLLLLPLVPLPRQPAVPGPIQATGSSGQTGWSWSWETVDWRVDDAEALASQIGYFSPVLLGLTVLFASFLALNLRLPILLIAGLWPFLLDLALGDARAAALPDSVMLAASRSVFAGWETPHVLALATLAAAVRARAQGPASWGPRRLAVGSASVLFAGLLSPDIFDRPIQLSRRLSESGTSLGVAVAAWAVYVCTSLGLMAALPGRWGERCAGACQGVGLVAVVAVPALLVRDSVVGSDGMGVAGAAVAVGTSTVELYAPLMLVVAALGACMAHVNGLLHAHTTMPEALV